MMKKFNSLQVWSNEGISSHNVCCFQSLIPFKWEKSLPKPLVVAIKVIFFLNMCALSLIKVNELKVPKIFQNYSLFVQVVGILRN